MAKHNTIAPKKRGRPLGSKNKPKPAPAKLRIDFDNKKTTTISPHSRNQLNLIRIDLEQRTGLRVPLRQVITYLYDSYMKGSFK